MTASMVPAIRARLVDLLTIAEAFEGVTISVGYPGDTAGPDLIWLGGRVDVEYENAAIGRNSRNETSTHYLYVESVVPGGVQFDAEQRVATLYEWLSSIFSDNKALGLDSVLSTRIARGQQDGGTTQNGVGCGMEVHVVVEARLI